MINFTNQIDLWSGTLSDLEPDRELYMSTLDPMERARMQQYRFAERGKAFALIRGWMRTVLSMYTGESPHNLQLGQETSGKPNIAAEQTKAAHERIEFNLSHSGEQFMLSVAIGKRLGLDIERIRNMDHMDSIARTYFTTEQCEALHDAQDEESRRYHFFAAWTQLEAYYKWSGSEWMYEDSIHQRLHCRTWELIPGTITSLVTERGNDTIRWIPWKRAVGIC